jgi:uncharacterized protein (TIGR00255 family)
MTGFARVRLHTRLGELAVSLRAVNHRALDLHFHLPGDLEPYEPAMRRLLSEAVRRGHVDIRAQIARVRGGYSASLNRPLLEAWIAAFREASAELAIPGEPDLNAALRTPGMIAEAMAEEPGADFEAEVLAVLQEAIRILNDERAREGARTATVLHGYAASIVEKVESIQGLRRGIQRLLQQRLEERLSEMLGAVVIEPARLAQEAAILADRSDISEELTRLDIHTKELQQLLSAGGDLGKKLEFLLQEMQRECNTILSKSNAAGEPGRAVTSLGLAIKSEIEKLREQSLNLE